MNRKCGAIKIKFFMTVLFLCGIWLSVSRVRRRRQRVCHASSKRQLAQKQRGVSRKESSCGDLWEERRPKQHFDRQNGENLSKTKKLSWFGDAKLQKRCALSAVLPREIGLFTAFVWLITCICLILLRICRRLRLQDRLPFGVFSASFCGCQMWLWVP